MDVFRLRDTVVNEYRQYVESFVRVLDPSINEFVRQQLEAGELWPDAVLQLNPAFVMDKTLGELAEAGIIQRETARFFGEHIRLYQHQREALDIAQRGEPCIVTTGTGSGKSLTYLVPIYDSIVRAQPQNHSVRAIIVYPMNALINSQLDALKSYASGFPESPVRFDRYTGQEREEDRARILADPPHILLTNYVMLEYLLVRPTERSLLATATRDLRFLVMDELHFYRGRQGADVAMLLRRVQQRAGHDLQVIGTSATMTTQGKRDERRQAVADVGTRLFGVTVQAKNVVDETLQRVAKVPVPANQDELRRAVEMEPPAPTVDAVTNHPLSAWLEEAFGLATEEGRLARREPETFANAVDRLARETGLDKEFCSQRLKAVLDAGNQAYLIPGQPIFAFRLHQFLSSGSSVYATLESPEARHLTMEGQYKADEERVLFPLAFCRECGQEYYLVSRIEEEGREKLIPRSPMVSGSDEDIPGQSGFFAIEDGGLWSGEDDELPEFWFDQLRSGWRIKPRYSEHRPANYRAAPDGSLSEPGQGSGVQGWFQPRPLMICLRCRAAYDLRDGDYRKLSSLSQTGRSTATTVVVNAAVSGMTSQDVPREEAKILSFTDNRQDASLQAGHLNDFVQVAQLRAGLVEALNQNQSITFDRLGPGIFEALQMSPEDFLKEPVASGPGYEQGRRAMIDLLEYRVLEDLSRGWRVAQPNLEQVGLLRIEYEGLAELAADGSRWNGLPAIEDSTPERRESVLKAVLDHLRMQLAIEVEALTEQATRRLAKNASQWLREPWALDERDVLRTQSLALLPNVQPDERETRLRMRRLGARSTVGRYLRSSRTWGIDHNLSASEVEELVVGIVSQLRGHILTVISDRRQEERGIRVMAGALRWTRGNGQAMPPDPVRARALYLRREIGEREPNRYFTGLYAQTTQGLRGMVSHEHTGQVDAGDRIEREELFRKGKLPALFCSPTMELGVDIRDLHSVHLRNVPPTPAHYAQRSGRAGRGGRPALIAAFAVQGNHHDQYFFRHRNRMIAGAVEPSRMDLRNRELVEAHIYSAWLSIVGMSLGSSVADILDLENPTLPILADKKAFLEGEYRARFEQEAIVAARQIVERAPELRDSWWFSESWLESIIRKAPEEFDKSFERWRELYRSAVNTRAQGQNFRDAPRATRQEREEGERIEREARREIDLLLNRTQRIEESDFYPYRYLASEGFLPGYNFPRLPVRALVSVHNSSRSIDRPRFLGLTEFGPGNVVYHEGRKYRVDSIVLPTSGIEERLRRAHICNVCGYVHDDDSVTVDLCECCGTRLDASTSEFPQRLLEQPPVRTRSVERISSDEEERIRSGYFVTTHFCFSPAVQLKRADIKSKEGDTLLEVLYAPAARIWRVNHGWRQGNHDGFSVETQTGRWGRRDVDLTQGEEEARNEAPMTGIKPFVTDNRNLLLMRPTVSEPSEEFLVTLLYALKRGIQFVHQVEEQEVAAELIGENEHRRLMFWEAAEGGTGVSELLMEDPSAIARIANQALRICHFNPETGQEEGLGGRRQCTVACYECLLSYTNQPEHRLLDRRLVRDFLLRLASSTTVVATSRSRNEQYEWLKSITDPKSGLEIQFLDFVFNAGYRLPDAAQNRPSPEVPAQPDFYYGKGSVPGACVFIDGSSHDHPTVSERDEKVRKALEDRGYRVITIRFEQGLDEQVRQHPDIFGVTN